jgi:phosphate transport system permease protein
LSDLPLQHPPGLSLDDLAGNARRMRTERVVRALLLGAALASILVSALIIGSLAKETIGFLSDVEWSTLVDKGWFPRRGQFDIRTIVVGSLIVTVIAMLVAGPLGLASAVYLAEYARPGIRRVLKPALEVLAGIPTVVFGYFALLFLTPLLQDIGIEVGTFSSLSAGIVVGVLLIPTVASISEDAMSAVPQDLRAGAYALGATKYRVATRIVVPAAISGIIASFVLGISRAVGETMIVYLAAGGQPNLTFNPLEPVQTMTAFIGATGLGDVPTGSVEYKTIFAVGLVLFVMTLIMNVFAIRMVRKYREVYE